MSLTQPLKWHGGKHYLAKKIIELMPPHLNYVEPYAGGLSVLLEKDPEGVSEVVNDLNCELTNFWHVLSREDEFTIFHRIAQAIPFSEMVYDLAEYNDNTLHYCPGHQRLDAVIRFFIRCRMSRAGAFKEFATLTRNRTRRGMNEQASAWLTAVEGLPAVHARLKRVVILNRPALDVIRQQDGENTLLYCDPPYAHSTRVTTDAYQHEMTDEDHVALLQTLSTIKGKFILSGYPSAMYNTAAQGWGWRRVDFIIDNKAAGGDTKRKMTESVWLNY
jgi:DNA adenine methylase